MLALSCHCGGVRIETAARPDHVCECNCSLCTKSGVRWAYFDPSQVAVGGVTTTYCRQDKAEPAADVHFCSRCGSTTHFTLTAGAAAKYGDTMMGVNVRLADERDLAGIELRYPDGRAWSGEGPFGYVRESGILGD